MSRFSNLFKAVARPHLLHHLGEPVTRYPRGDSGSAIGGLTGIFNEREAIQEKSRGEDNSRTGRLQLADSIETDPTDVWLLRGEEWSTTSISGSMSGFKILSLKKRERQRTKPVRPT